MFKLRTLFFLIPCSIVRIAFAQVPPCTNYQGDFCFGSLGHDVVNKAIPTSDGNVLMVGSTQGFTGGNIASTRYGVLYGEIYTDGLVLKIAPDGTLLWSRIFGGSGMDLLKWVAELPGGGYLVAGSTASADGTIAGPIYGFDIGAVYYGWCMRLDADGNLLWTDRIGFGAIQFVDGALTSAGNEAILLSDRSMGVRIDLAGNVLLSSSNFSGDRIVASPDGSFLIERGIPVEMAVAPFLSEGVGGDPIGDVGVVNVDQNGAINWVNRIKANSVDYSGPMLALPDGYLIVVRSLFGSPAFERTAGSHGDADFWLVRLNLSGSILWDQVLGSEQLDQPADILLESDGGFVMLGLTQNAPSLDVTEASRGARDLWVVRTDPLGNKVWDKRWGGTGDDLPIAVVPVPSGYVLVANSNSPRSGDHQHPGFMRDQQDIWMVQMYPGLPTHWYYDADSDGLGRSTIAPLDDCVQPPFYVSNNWDCNDLVPNPPDQYLGAPCNDGDWHTINDLLQPGCICSGTFVDVSNITPITFTLWPDLNPGETTWELRDMTTQQIAMQGGPYPNGQQGVPESATELFPPVCNQRFQLFVYDGAANGMVGGRYTLTAGGKRLIDSDGNFQQVSTVSSTLIPISVPVGNIALTASTCDRLDLLSNSVIVSEEDPQVSLRYNLKESCTGYQFWIFDPHGSYSRRVFLSHKNPGKGGGSGAQKPRYLKLSSISTTPVPQFKLLNVRVRPRINGIYGAFGAACTMKIDPSACPMTQVNNLPNDIHYSCDQTYPLNGTQRIWAIPKSGVNKYQFQFTDQQAAYVRAFASTTPSVLLSVWNTLPLQPLHVYDVRVRCSKDNGATYCAWGPSCTIYTAGTGRSAELADGIGSVGLHVFPNPATDGTVRVQLTFSGALEGPGEVTITDMAGRTVMYALVDAINLGDQPMELHPSLVPGTYVISVSCNGDSYRERFVVQ